MATEKEIVASPSSHIYPELMREVALAARLACLAFGITMVVVFQGCTTTYAVLKGSDFPNPPDRKLRIFIGEFKDLTHQYDSVGMRLDDLLRSRLRNDTLRILEDAREISWAPRQYIEVPNIFLPIEAEEKTDVDLFLSGTVEEVFFGPKGFDMAAMAMYGYLGAAMVEDQRVGRVSFRVELMEYKTMKTLFSGRIDSIVDAKQRDRTETLQLATQASATKTLSFLLETQSTISRSRAQKSLPSGERKP